MLLRLRKQKKIQILLLMLSCCLLSPQGTAATCDEVVDKCPKGRDDMPCVRKFFQDQAVSKGTCQKTDSTCLGKAATDGEEEFKTRKCDQSATTMQKVGAGVGLTAGALGIAGGVAALSGKSQAMKDSKRTREAAEQTAADTREMADRKRAKDAAKTAKTASLSGTENRPTATPTRKRPAPGEQPPAKKPRVEPLTPHTPLKGPVKTGKPQNFTQKPFPMPAPKK